MAYELWHISYGVTSVDLSREWLAYFDHLQTDAHRHVWIPADQLLHGLKTIVSRAAGQIDRVVSDLLAVQWGVVFVDAAHIDVRFWACRAFVDIAQ